MTSADPTAISLLELNDDCLLAIFEMLDLKAQGELKMVCRRFKHLILECWSMHCKAWRKNDYITGSLIWMTINLRNFVEEIDMMDVHYDEFQFLSQYTFPNVNYLKFRSVEVPIEMLHKIVAIFPNLTQLEIKDDIYLRTILLMRNLTDLTIEFTKTANLFGLKEIFRELKLRKLSITSLHSKICYTEQDLESVQECVTLEEICLPAEILHSIAPLFEKLPKLHVISCFAYLLIDCPHEKTIFSEVLDVVGNRVTHLISENIVNQFPMNQLSKLPKMHTWTIKDRSLSPYDLETLSADLKNLFELDILETQSNDANDCGDGVKELNPIELLSACPNLRTLALPFEWVNNKLTLEDVVDVLESQSERQVPLSLKCYENECITEEEWPIRERHPLLSVSIIQFPGPEDDIYSVYKNCHRMFKLFLDR